MSAVLRKTVTIVFADIAGSTDLGERLDAEVVRDILDRYFAEMQHVLERHGGTIEKFIGDAVVAVFGVPKLHENDALRAVRAATEMRLALDTLNRGFEQESNIQLDLRIGINTGEAVAGETVSGQRYVTGDCVNVAARLQQHASPGDILIGQTTFELVRDAVEAQATELLMVKGKSSPLRAWRLGRVRPRSDRIAATTDTAMVGRNLELDELRHGLDEAISSHGCRLITCLGPPGIGKSRLANEFLERLTAEFSVLRGHCLEYGEGITYAPVAEIVERLGGLESSVALVNNPDERDFVRRHIARAIGVEPGGSSTAEIFSAIRELLEALARERPVVVVVDDIHWAEPTLLDLIEDLVATGTNGSVLIVCLARPELFELRPGWKVRKPHTQTLSIEPLSTSDSLELLRAQKRSGDLDPSRADRIANAAAGNPLFLQQMLAMIGDDPMSNNVPPTVQALIAARLERLESRERAILEAAAVEGEHFDAAEIRALTGVLDERTFHSHLLALVQKQLVEREPARLASVDPFRFVHVLVRDVAYEGIPKSRRADLHEQLAERFERLGGGRDELSGLHLEYAYRYWVDLRKQSRAAEVGKRASGYLAEAGNRAFARGDMTAASNLLDRATSLPGLAVAERGELLVLLGSALARSGDFVRCDEILAQVIIRAAETSDHNLESRALVERAAWRLWREPKTANDARLTAASAIHHFEQTRDERGLAQSWRLVADAESTWQGSLDALDRAVTYGRAAGDRREVSDALWWASVAMHFGPMPVEQGIVRCQQILTDARDDRTLEAGIRGILAGLLAMRGQFQEARVLYEEGFAILAELGLNLRMATRRTISGAVELLAGDPVAAERELTWAIERLENMGERIDRPGVAAQLAEALYQQGRYEEAEQFAEIGEEGAHAARVRYRFAVRAKLWARRGELSAAEREARRIVELASTDDNLTSRGHALIDLAEVLRMSGKTGDARLQVESALRLYEKKGNTVSAATARAILADVSS
jgi:class 3 adenylate cyclase/tetratricopeptide (TPR) repeat protein